MRNSDVLRNEMGSRMPEVKMSKLPNRDPTCPVCMGEMETGRLLPCGHIIHESCLGEWLTRQEWCPLCRHPVLEPHPSGAADEILKEIQEFEERQKQGESR